MAIVTISHEMGSGGAELEMALASHLSYGHVDHDVILERTRTYGLAEDRLAHLEEDKPSLFERFDTETRRYIMVIQTVLYELAAEDGVVMMGRGGQWLLRGKLLPVSNTLGSTPLGIAVAFSRLNHGYERAAGSSAPGSRLTGTDPGPRRTRPIAIFPRDSQVDSHAIPMS